MPGKSVRTFGRTSRWDTDPHDQADVRANYLDRLSGCDPWVHQIKNTTTVARSHFAHPQARALNLGANHHLSVWHKAHVCMLETEDLLRRFRSPLAQECRKQGARLTDRPTLR